MKIIVKLFATLTNSVSDKFPDQYPQGVRSGNPINLELHEGSTLEDLVALLDLPREIVKVTFVNGRAQRLSYRLEPGDEVGIFPPIAGGSMEKISIEVWLYGPLAQYGGKAAKKSHANLVIELNAGSQIKDLLDYLALPTEERGLTFINGDLSAMPDFQPDLNQMLADGDRVAFFHLNSMWPAQYRDGAGLAAGMETAMEDRKRFHHRPGD